ncbi:hypothetical protein [Streptomyces sp. NPDC086989]|uniref:hypothetical protein n=1 Tax=Streptomyces sp. NPDC086989 TaxID=3365764 RepID=UPI003821D7B4
MPGAVVEGIGTRDHARFRVRPAALDGVAELRAILIDSWLQAAPGRLAAARPEPAGR